MPDTLPASLRLHIDRAALQHNWLHLDRMSGSANAAAAVKADAYGIGVEHAVPALRDAGASEFFVAHWSEVSRVAVHVPPRSIAVLHGPNTREEADFARSLGVVPVINSLHQAQIWSASGGGRCHLMIDSGINRLGLSLGDVGAAIIGELEVDCLMSHLASADEDSAMNELQLDRFASVFGVIGHKRRSFANSAGIALGPAYHFDQTRPGLALYGGVPRAELANDIRQVAYPQAAVIQLRDIEAGDGVGYNATFVASRNMRVAVISIGYADGFLRPRGPGSSVQWKGESLPILGKVSMDMIVVDASASMGLREGDWLDIPFSLPETAAKSGISQYELLTTIGNRFDRSTI